MTITVAGNKKEYEEGISIANLIKAEDIDNPEYVTVTVNGGSTDVAYKEVLRDYSYLIPSEYTNDSEKLHFNLWLTNEFQLGN